MSSFFLNLFDMSVSLPCIRQRQRHIVDNDDDDADDDGKRKVFAPVAARSRTGTGETNNAATWRDASLRPLEARSSMNMSRVCVCVFIWPIWSAYVQTCVRLLN